LAAPIWAQLDAEACFRLYYGAGPTRDLTRARACFETEVPKRTCNETPFHLDRLYLAAMYLDAQGGAADLDKARALLSECFNDADIAELRQRTAARESAPPGPAGKLDFCGSLAGTTRAGMSCSLLASLRIDAALGALEKSVLARLDPPGRELYRKWKVAGDQFAETDAAAIFESTSPGTLAPAASNDRVNEIHAQQVRVCGNCFATGFTPRTTLPHWPRRCAPCGSDTGNSSTGANGPRCGSRSRERRRRGSHTGMPHPLSTVGRSSWVTAARWRRTC
jgi:hypothetical protein